MWITLATIIAVVLFGLTPILFGDANVLLICGLGWLCFALFLVFVKAYKML